MMHNATHPFLIILLLACAIAGIHCAGGTSGDSDAAKSTAPVIFGTDNSQLVPEDFWNE